MYNFTDTSIILMDNSLSLLTFMCELKHTPVVIKTIKYYGFSFVLITNLKSTITKLYVNCRSLFIQLYTHNDFSEKKLFFVRNMFEWSGSNPSSVPRLFITYMYMNSLCTEDGSNHDPENWNTVSYICFMC